MDLHDASRDFLTAGKAFGLVLMNQIVTTVVENPLESAAISLAIVGLIGIGVYRDRVARLGRRIIKLRLSRGQRMTRTERKAYLRRAFGDVICDAMEEGLAKGRFTEPEAKDFCRKLDRLADLRGDLLPAEAKSESRFHMHTEHTPNIPGPKPGEVDNVVTFEPRPKKAWGSKFLNRKAG